MKEKRSIVQGASLHKRAPQRPASVPSDIYISHKTKTNVIIARVRQLMVNQKYKQVTLHGMGATLVKTITVAQAIQRTLHNQIDLKPTTNTVTLVDDVIPDDTEKDIETQTRMNSAIHIQLVAKDGLAELQQRVAPLARKPSRNRKMIK
ncbi:hypothetical protein BJV82DRAFT_623420 [Fennellomyces sp. T-0311]|nr:hypothetical protein BJV82DRAFT_623420 [Fennellomyces sp. T-0311]